MLSLALCFVTSHLHLIPKVGSQAGILVSVVCSSGNRLQNSSGGLGKHRDRSWPRVIQLGGFPEWRAPFLGKKDPFLVMFPVSVACDLHCLSNLLGFTELSWLCFPRGRHTRVQHLWHLAQRFFFFLGWKMVMIASSKTVLRPFWVSAEHSR